MLHFEGESEFPQMPEQVWAKLSDARFLVQCLPEVTSVSHLEPRTAQCVLRPGLSFMRGTLEVTLQVADAVSPTLVRVHGHGKGIGSSNDVEATLAIEPQGSGTRVHWSADITNLHGLLKAVPQGLLKGAAQKVIGDVWATVANQLSG